MPAIAYRKNTGEGLDKASMVVEYEAIQKGGSDDGKVKERIITVKEIQSEIPLPGRAGLLRLSGFASRKTILSLYSTTLRKDVMLEGTGAMRFALHRCGAKLSPSNRLSNWISIIIEAARVDEGAVWGVVEFGKRYHGVAYYPEQLMNDIEREVLRHQPTTTVTVACGDGMSVLVQKDVESGDWKAIRLLRLSKPQRMAFKNQQQFLSACAEYYTSSWILENPSGPQFRPDRALESAGAGRWVARTCKTVIDSKGRHEAGLLVVVDDEGSLVELKELNTAP
jgi:hypothetical protein